MQKSVANPQLKWAQRKDKVYITFDLIEVQDPQIDIVDGKVLKFSGSDKNHTYSLELELFEEISKEDSKYVFATRNIFLNLKKKEKGPYWPRLTKNTGKLNFLNVDWNLYIDEDDEDEAQPTPNFGNFGQEQSFPGMGMEDEMDDEDDLPVDIKPDDGNFLFYLSFLIFILLQFFIFYIF
jgi:prostaglandin-E synthase